MNKKEKPKIFIMLPHQEKERYLTIQSRGRATRWSYKNKIEIPEIKNERIMASRARLLSKQKK